MSLGKSITESRGELWSLEAEGPACRTGAPGAASGGDAGDTGSTGCGKRNVGCSLRRREVAGVAQLIFHPFQATALPTVLEAP